jgi:hypothetical protein
MVYASVAFVCMGRVFGIAIPLALPVLLRRARSRRD